MTESVTSDYCRRCGRVVLSGEIDLIPAQLDFDEIDAHDAAVLARHGHLVAQLKIKMYGTERIVTARWYWPEPEVTEWINLPLHRCYREDTYDIIDSRRTAPNALGQPEGRRSVAVHPIRGESDMASLESPPF